MRTPANSTKQFMNQLITIINVFFKKISKNQTSFHLSQHYLISKKSQSQKKGKDGRKQEKYSQDQASEKAKILMRAYKSFKNDLLNSRQTMEQVKDLSQSSKNKYCKKRWNQLPQQQKQKWCRFEKREHTNKEKRKERLALIKQDNDKQQIING